MSKLVFKLRNVPMDEAQDIRELLEGNDIAYFETSAGNWGISLPAIWIHESREFEFTRQLIDEYQSERTERLRREYQLSRENGEAKTVWQSFKRNPLRFIAFSVIIVVILTIYMRVFVFF
ncbi:MAG: hypothetical protein JKY29_08905 [Gammaproteobacteria bacterium]|nr:hypothetical protein [Gammaproteobacteria bacterium]MBL4728754.1 hypothetical protein [Gammaproteobacteria bacterium]